MLRRPTSVALVLALVVLSAASVRADGSWLDQPLAPWNHPGMAIPAPPQDPGGVAWGSPPQCQPEQRLESAEAQLVAAAGWAAITSRDLGQAVTLVTAWQAHDGMCRPWAAQQLIFVDGAFAGTISPVTMNARLDGDGGVIALDSRKNLWALFTRCEESESGLCRVGFEPQAQRRLVEYTLDSAEGGVVLRPSAIWGELQQARP